VNHSEHGLSAVISKHPGEPLSITGPSPYIETTDSLPAYAGILRAPTGWWGIVVHRPRGIHPQEAIQHFETEPQPIIWCGPSASIGLYRLPTQELVVSARIQDSALMQMKLVIAVHSNKDFAESRFEKRRVPAGVRYLPGKQLQLWFSL
jgi:hypothetical protein